MREWCDVADISRLMHPFIAVMDAIFWVTRKTAAQNMRVASHIL
jgi:hypothetical protein